MTRALQIAVALAALVPISAGLMGAWQGPHMVEAIPSGLALDGHFRYLSGLLLAIGLGFWSTLPRIETHAARFRLLTAIVFIGGLARLYGAVTMGWPSGAMLFGLGMELIVTPALCFWQARVSKAAGLG